MRGVRPEKLFWLLCSFIESHTVLKRNDAISGAVNNHDWHWRDGGNPVGSFVIIGYRQAEGDLERPGELEGTEFFFGDVSEAREGAVENDSVQFGSLVSLHPFAGQGYAQGAAEALA